MCILIGVNQKPQNPFGTKGFSRYAKITYSRAKGSETPRPLGMTGLTRGATLCSNIIYYAKGVMARRPLAGTGFFSKCVATNRNVHMKVVSNPYPYVDSHVIRGQ